MKNLFLAILIWVAGSAVLTLMLSAALYHEKPLIHIAAMVCVGVMFVLFVLVILYGIRKTKIYFDKHWS